MLFKFSNLNNKLHARCFFQSTASVSESFQNVMGIVQTFETGINFTGTDMFKKKNPLKAGIIMSM